MTAASPRQTWLRANVIEVSILGIFLALYAVFLIGAWDVFSQFAIYRSFMTTLPYFGIMALSATFVVTLGEIDLSFPSIMGLSAWLFSMLYTETGSLELAIVCCVLCGAVLGLGNGLLVTLVGIPSIVATIGTMFLWRGAVNILSGGRGIALVEAKEEPLYPLFAGEIQGVPTQFLWFVGFGVLFAMLYRRHRFGGHVLYVGDNEASARMMGIHVGRVKAICFAQLGACAAFSGIFLLMEVTYFWPTTGEGFLLTTLAAVFIGGTSVFGGRGTMIGTFMGVLIIGSLEAGIIALGLDGFYTQFIYGLMIAVAVSLYALILGRGR